MVWGEFGAKSLAFIDRPIERDPRITILHGSVRSGKTVTCMPKLFEYCKRGPGGVIAISGVSKQTVKRNVLNDIFDTVGETNYRYNNTTGELRLFDRHCQIIGMKDEGSERYIRGGTYAGWFGDEATTIPRSSFTQMLNRLSVTGSKAYLTTNPDSPYHYLNTEYINSPERIDSGMVRVIHFELNDNPNLSDEYKNFIRSAYSGLWYKRMILGQWVAAEGAIYDMFDDARNIRPMHDIPDFDRKFIGIDYGAGNPTVFVKIGVTHNREGVPSFWIYDEWYHDGRTGGSKTTVQYKQALIDFVGDERFDKIFPDPSALALIIELKSGSCGKRFGNICFSNNEVLPGINSVATPISQGRLIIVKERCPQTLMEMYSYVWDAKAQERGEDAPVKAHDHCLDAVRYPIHTMYPAAKTKRWVA